jgi:signal transduction histidine kinase/ligand-binding sensor domain-containing protein/DNA-binding response OmpR family regulator
MIIAWRQLFCFAFILITVSNAAGQPKCKIEYYTTEQGLSHQAITSFIKDNEGFMWFGSWDGINRFDGHSFVAYKSTSGDMSQLGNGRIDQIVEDQSGHLWIEAYDRQIYRFDKRTEQFQPLSSFFSSGAKQKIRFRKILFATNNLVWLQSETEGVFCVRQNDMSKEHIVRYSKEERLEYQLPSNEINFWYQDQQSSIWAGTKNGLCNLAPSSAGIYKINRIIPQQLAIGKTYIAVDEDVNHLYFGTLNGILVIFNKKTKAFFYEKITDGSINSLVKSKRANVVYAATSKGDLISFDVEKRNILAIDHHASGPFFTVMYEDKKGFLWIGAQKPGAVRYDPFNRSFQSFFTRHLSSVGNPFKISEDNNGVVWINMKGGGFGYYNEEKGAIENALNTSDGSIYQLPNVVYNYFFDEAGILWLTTDERELIKIILQGNDFKQQLLVEHGLMRTDNEARGMLYDKQNKLWIGAKSGILYVYQNGKKLGELFDNEPATGLGPVYSILEDSKGNIWLGTKGNGLFKASPINQEQTKYHLTHFVPGKDGSDGLICKDIYALLEDKQGRIWVGSFDNGLTLVQPEKDSVKFIHAGNALANYPKGSFHKIRTMTLDEAGNIWIGTTSGLLILDVKSTHSHIYKYATYSKVPGDKESLGNNDVQFIYRDSKNRMWLATSGGGFCLAIGKEVFQSLKFRNYTTKDGLPNDYILSCAEDKKGYLWIATENGLSAFKPETGVFKNYDSYEGLPRASFSEASVCQSLPDGQLFFGMTKGYLSFNPRSISTDSIAANIVFTNLQINNEDVGPGKDENLLKNDINYVSDLTLKYNQNIISIDYSILDYRSGNHPVFAYRLIGFDDEWHADRSQRTVTYTNLPSGRYVFEVKSLSNDLYSNTPYKRLAITILPPPWKTWWAYTLYTIATIALFLFIRRTALAMIRLRNKIAVEQKLAALKLQFFTNVSHELRTPLTLIVNPLDEISKKEKLSPQGHAYIEVARKNAGRMVRFVNQLLDLRKVQSDKATLQISRVEIISFVSKVCDHFTEAARSKRIGLEVVAEQKELVAWVDAEKLDVVIYNLLSNSIKFTPEGKSIKVGIKSLPPENCFSIAVCDQGPGVKADKLQEIFELFHEEDCATNRAFKGSGIGLALSKEFVSLHGGTIWADNNEDGGLTVTVKMNLGSGHYTNGEVSFVDAPKTSSIINETSIEQQILPLPANNGFPKDKDAPLVLLVEDNTELRQFLKNQLSEFYRVEVAKDGGEGWQKAVNLLPDLIVSDIMMPVMDGIQMLDRIKNDISTSHIPVVLLSAKYSIESQIEGLTYGADYYITKPFNNEFLIASINNLLRQRKKLFESLVQKKSIPLSPGPIVVTSKDEIFLKDVIHTVEEKMADPEFNIETVAETMAMSRTTFYKKFKSLTGLAPVEFVREVRLQRAKQYLDAGGNNVSEVAYLVGFGNPKYFSTCFKEKYQLSPSDYLKSKLPQQPGS